MEEKDMIMNETCEETVQQPAWEVVPDLETVEEALEEVEEAVEEVLEDAEKELKRGIAAVKEWLHNTLYEANRLFKEHKIAVLAIIGGIAAAAAVIGVLVAVFKKKD